MFSRRERLPKALFPSALKTGRRISSPQFSVIVPEAVHGYAVVVSKKVARLSVTRHRIKRQVLAALKAAPVLPPALILFPQASVARMTYKDIKVEILHILSKIQ